MWRINQNTYSKGSIFSEADIVPGTATIGLFLGFPIIDIWFIASDYMNQATNWFMNSRKDRVI